MFKYGWFKKVEVDTEFIIRNLWKKNGLNIHKLL